RAARGAPGRRARAGAHAHGAALRAAHDRSRPPPLRDATRGRAWSNRSSCAPARARVRPRAAARPRSRARRAGPRAGGRPAGGARLKLMSHLDELDEFEAELELRLKKEYTAVFGLFRYCILTQDATYLCNKLDLKVVPQASYPFFHIQMEDVWVWD